MYPAILLFGMTGLLIMAVVRVWWAPGLGFGMVSACNVAWVVLSFTRVLSTAAMPIGATLGGFMTQTVDPAVIFLVAATTKAIEVLIARFSAMYDL